MSDLLIPFGLSNDGRVVTPEEVPGGAACGCVCTGCGGSLIAAQGAVYRWHFRHAAAGADATCNYTPESDAHRWAKQTIIEAGWITVPRLDANYRGRTRPVSGAHKVSFTVAQPERWMGDIARRPDILAETEAGLLAIEIWVAHRCEPEKISDFAAHRLASIEVDLSDYRQSVPRDIVLTTARRAWIFHPDKAALDAQFALDEQERERLEAERVAEVARLRREWAAARAAERAAEQEAERAAREVQQAEQRRVWLEQAAEAREHQRRIAAEAAIVQEAQRRAQAIQDAIRRRREAELQIASAQSAVLLFEQHWGGIPGGETVLTRARANLAAAEQRYAADLADIPVPSNF
jgi:hypothetical protein